VGDEIVHRLAENQSAQALTEYGLLLAVLAIIVTAILTTMGARTAEVFSQVAAVLAGQTKLQPASAQQIANDFLNRINMYYQQHGSWPRSWGDYRFSDLGLNPQDWTNAVDGVFWNPNGDKLGLANRAGDDLQIYVQDLNGNTLHLYDGWNIWCTPGNHTCYYHTVAPGNEVNLDTLQVVKQ
jgi:Flp pilus assembly pilin Flp